MGVAVPEDGDVEVKDPVEMADVDAPKGEEVVVAEVEVVVVVEVAAEVEVVVAVAAEVEVLQEQPVAV